MLHDNLKTAILSHTPNGVISWHPRYLDFADYYGFRPRACQPYRAQTKGKVERVIQYIRGNFWNGLQYTDLTDFNQQAWQWLTTVANVRTHGTTGAVPLERWPHEQLAPLHARPPYDTSVITYRQSSRDCFVSYAGNFYSVPATYVHQQLCLRVTETGDLFITHPDGHQIAHHRVSMGRHARIVDATHYHGLAPNCAPPGKVGARQVAPTVLDAPQVAIRPLSVYAQCAEVPS